MPYPAESALSGVQKHSDYMFYRRIVEVPKNFTNGDQRLRLNFGAVNYDATVYVNGIELARHTGAYDAFSVDITSALRARGPVIHSGSDNSPRPAASDAIVTVAGVMSG
ncbi:sugar-binding domain-containing protein [Lacisediminihabitans sp. H27-G8]|uniref:sugar-binding domain-containing protein n=1 Tax=Lacisediminihabitans sp. H27-G8 TaxID=3111909 RepID=UPI0038FCDA81